jgi:hypothetical protein
MIARVPTTHAWQPACGLPSAIGRTTVTRSHVLIDLMERLLLLGP